METNTIQSSPITADVIRALVASGHRVFVGNRSYEVVKDKIGQWLIVCAFNGYAIGLTWADGVTLNCKPSELIFEASK